MKAAATMVAAVAAGLFSLAAGAQTTGSEVQRDVNHRRIEQDSRRRSAPTPSKLESERRVSRAHAINAEKGGSSRFAEGAHPARAEPGKPGH
jgi:hypothetical protein